jgi:peptidoglycan/LPS O-acetylase OafA/YrhL
VALVLLSLILGQMWRPRGQLNFIHHALLIHNFRDDFIFGINGSFWSLAVEAQYYLLYPLLLAVTRVIGIHAVLATSLAVKLGIALLTSAGIIPATPDTAACLMMPERYFEWILGMYVADRLLAGQTAFPLHWSTGWLCFAAAVGVHWSGSLSLAVVPLVSLGTAIWIYQIVRIPAQPWKIERLLFPIGIVSYSLYLWHQPIIGEVVNRIVRNQNALRTLSEPGLMLVAVLVAAAVSALVAAGSYRLTEVPSMELTKKLAKWIARTPPKAAHVPRKLAA